MLLSTSRHPGTPERETTVYSLLTGQEQNIGKYGILEVSMRCRCFNVAIANLLETSVRPLQH